MARAATTADVFNAIAEAGRRQILDLLKEGETAVGAIVARLGMSQPQVSKHLGVLRTVGVVRSRTEGRRRLYRVDGQALQEVHDWIATFEQHWNDRLDRLDDHLTNMQETPR